MDTQEKVETHEQTTDNPHDKGYKRVFSMDSITQVSGNGWTGEPVWKICCGFRVCPGIRQQSYSFKDQELQYLYNSLGKGMKKLCAAHLRES